MSTTIIPSEFLTKKGTEKRDNISRCVIAAIKSGTARTGQSGSKYQAGSVWTGDVVRNLVHYGYDAIGMNDAPRGGKTGEHVVITRSGDKTDARKAFVRKWREGNRRNIADAAYKALIATPEFLEKEVKRAVMILGQARGESPALNDERDCYSGCGVYRVGWKNGKIVCAVHGGFHNSKPYLMDEFVWMSAVIAYMMQYADHIVKMDGSGCQFFFRDEEDAELVGITPEIYTVPSAYGGRHLNIQAPSSF